MSPKERFQKHRELKELAALIASEKFEYIAETAMLTFVSNLPSGNDATSSMCAHQQLVGARTFLQTIMNLPKLPTEPARPTGQLDHRV